MEFNVINLANLLIIAVIMIPNIIYALKGGEDAVSAAPIITVLEQVGRYASMALMILPLGVWKFGFPSVTAFLVYLFGNGALLATYILTWVFYFRRKTFAGTVILAIAPVLIFALTGVCLCHWLLVAAAVLFGICHLSISLQKPEEKSPRS